MHARSPDIIEYILIIYDKNAWCDQFKVVYYLCSPQKILPDTSIHQTGESSLTSPPAKQMFLNRHL
jgi:hypothetical protein